MTATFNPSLTSQLDRVRQHIGDTNVAAALIQNETITVLLAETGATALSVSVKLARNIAAQYAQKATYDVDGQGERLSDLSKNFRQLAADLADELADERAVAATEDVIAEAVAMGGGIMVTGTSVSENMDRSEDTDRAANYGARYDGW